MPNPVLAIAGSSIVGAKASSNAAKKSASAATSAAEMSNETQRYIYNDSVERGKPYETAGKNALAQMSYEMGIGENPNPLGGDRFDNFRNGPGYQFQVEEGQKALERGAAAGGMLNSGAFAKDAMRFSQGLADQSYGNYYNRLAGIAGTGQTQNGQMNALGQNYANAVGQNNTMAANARASGYQGQANALNGLINNGMGIYGAYKGGMFN